MESSAEKEAESKALLDRMTDSVRVSDRQGCPDTAAKRGTEQEEDCFFDCEETLDGEAVDSGSGDSQRKRDSCEPSPVSQPCQGAGGDGGDAETDRIGDSRDTGVEHTDAGSGESPEALGERTPVAGEEREEGGAGEEAGPEEGEEENNKEKWNECTDEEDKMADTGADSDSELKEEVNTAPEFDEERLREEEKDLTEEEKESRRAESMKLKEKGNVQFKGGEHPEAEESYTAALGVCPVCYSKERAILFSNRAAARLHLDKNDKAIADCTKAIELKPDYVRAILRRAELYEKTDKLDEALEDYKAVLEQDPGQHAARDASTRLPPLIHERNEKLKEEMMSKLKDLGNMFLRPFGLSTSNFQVNQDSDTGSYSVNFVQGANNNNR